MARRRVMKGNVEVVVTDLREILIDLDDRVGDQPVGEAGYDAAASVLVEHGMVPLSRAELKGWQQKQVRGAELVAAGDDGLEFLLFNNCWVVGREGNTGYWLWSRHPLAPIEVVTD